MEKPHNKTDSTNESAKNLTCWRTATSPQCLRVKTVNEVHLFPYGYYQHAKFVRQNGKDVLQIQFQERIVLVKGKGLEPLCDALERLSVAATRFSKPNANWFSFISEWRNINSPTLTPKFSPSSPKNVHCKTRSNGRGRIIERCFSDPTWQKNESGYAGQNSCFRSSNG